jgi:hypothetical protein
MPQRETTHDEAAIRAAAEDPTKRAIGGESVARAVRLGPSGDMELPADSIHVDETIDAEETAGVGGAPEKSGAA